MWKAILAIIAGLIVSTPAFAQTWLAPYGGPGGGGFVETCGGERNFMIGMTGRTGDWVDAIMPICARYEHDTKTLGAAYTLGQHGGDGGSPASATCPTGMVVKGLDIGKVDNGGQVLVRYVRLICQSLPVRPEHSPLSHAAFFGIDNERFTYPATLTCGEFEVAAGIHGASGAYVDRLGLYCKDAPIDLGHPVPAPPRPRVKDSTTAETKPRLETPQARTPAGPPMSLGLYSSPKLVTADGHSERLDLCQQWGSACGKPAADAFCKTKGRQGALSFEPDLDIGRTIIIGSGAICADPTCDGFKTIQCGS